MSRVHAIYDTIGSQYSPQRQADPRIFQAIIHALKQAASVVNVGAGTGSYEPLDRRVVAVEPSRVMISQRPGESSPVVQASAIALPFIDRSFDAALAVLTIHHWENQRLGMSELRRVSRQRAVILTWDPDFNEFWLTDYLPEILEIDRVDFPSLDFFGDFGEVSIQRVVIPRDCTDGFLGAYWSRPHAYLDSRVRAGISIFSKLADVRTGLRRLESDLADGVWEKRYGHIRHLPHLDLGYVLVAIEF